MIIHRYETSRQRAGARPRYDGTKPDMKATPVTKHSDTREPIRRVVLGDPAC
jgi:hypothetical protein